MAKDTWCGGLILLLVTCLVDLFGRFCLNTCLHICLFAVYLAYTIGLCVSMLRIVSLSLLKDTLSRHFALCYNHQGPQSTVKKAKRQ